MRKKIVSYTPLLWLLAIPVLNVFYGILNRDTGNVGSLMTDLDYAIPFIPAFIVPYLIWYPFMIGMFVLLFFKNRASYYRTLVILCTGLVLSYVTFYFFQTKVDRPLLEDGGILNALVRLVYTTDQPYNCFPSIHVLTTYIMLKASERDLQLKRSIQMCIFILSWAIIASTVFVKQHALLDAAGAILYVECMYGMVLWFQNSAKKKPASVSNTQ